MDFVLSLLGFPRPSVPVCAPVLQVQPPIRQQEPRPYPKTDDYIHCVICARLSPRWNYADKHKCKSTMGFTKICVECRDLVSRWDGWTEESIAKRIADPVTLVNVFHATNTRRKAKNRRLDSKPRRITKSGFKPDSKIPILRASIVKELRPDVQLVVRKRGAKKRQ